MGAHPNALGVVWLKQRLPKKPISIRSRKTNSLPFAKEEIALSEMKKPNKSQFIRSQPASVVASEVVKKAKDAGMSISPQMVYAIRSAARKRGAKPASGSAARRKTLGARASSIARGASSDPTAQQFLNLVASIGLTRAEALFADVKARLASLRT